MKPQGVQDIQETPHDPNLKDGEYRVDSYFIWYYVQKSKDGYWWVVDERGNPITVEDAAPTFPSYEDAEIAMKKIISNK